MRMKSSDSLRGSIVHNSFLSSAVLATGLALLPFQSRAENGPAPTAKGASAANRISHAAEEGTVLYFKIPHERGPAELLFFVTKIERDGICLRDMTGNDRRLRYGEEMRFRDWPWGSAPELSEIASLPITVKAQKAPGKNQVLLSVDYPRNPEILVRVSGPESKSVLAKAGDTIPCLPLNIRITAIKANGIELSYGFRATEIKFGEQTSVGNFLLTKIIKAEHGDQPGTARVTIIHPGARPE